MLPVESSGMVMRLFEALCFVAFAVIAIFLYMCGWFIEFKFENSGWKRFDDIASAITRCLALSLFFLSLIAKIVHETTGRYCHSSTLIATGIYIALCGWTIQMGAAMRRADHRTVTFKDNVKIL